MRNLSLSQSKNAMCRYGSNAVGDVLWSCNNGFQVTCGACCDLGNIAEGCHYDKYTCKDGNIAKGGVVWDRCAQGINPNSDVNTCTVGT